MEVRKWSYVEDDDDDVGNQGLKMMENSINERKMREKCEKKWRWAKKMDGFATSSATLY